MKYLKSLMEKVRKGEGGFTLMELLIVIAILGVLAAVVVMNIGGFLGKGEVEAANAELHSMQTAVMAIMADAGRSDITAATGITQGSSITVGGTAYPLSTYLAGTIKGTYSVDGNGLITGTSYPGNVEWDATKNVWKKK
jgi:type IV pilus assembly protein PilA